MYVTYTGGCHCGKIAFTVEGELESLMECNCSICVKRGYLLWFVPRQQLILSTPESNLATYTFHTGVIKHHFCTTCGCGPFGEGTDKNKGDIAAVNVRCLDNFDISKFKINPFDGKSL